MFDTAKYDPEASRVMSLSKRGKSRFNRRTRLLAHWNCESYHAMRISSEYKLYRSEERTLVRFAACSVLCEPAA